MSRRFMLRETAVIALSFVTAIACSPLLASAASVLIDFETIPGGGASSNGLVITDQFPGIVFSTEGGGAPVLAQLGGQPTAFFGPPQHTTYDSLAAGVDMGEFFLTDDGIINQMPKVVVISFINPVGSVGGDLLDVDGDEIWNLEIRDSNGQAIDSQTLSANSPNTGDGIPSPFLFSLPTNSIGSLRMAYAGASDKAGFGFDNLTAENVVGTVPIPLPPAVWTGLGMLGGLWMIGAVRRRHRRLVSTPP